MSSRHDATKRIRTLIQNRTGSVRNSEAEAFDREGRDGFAKIAKGGRSKLRHYHRTRNVEVAHRLIKQKTGPAFAPHKTEKAGPVLYQFTIIVICGAVVWPACAAVLASVVVAFVAFVADGAAPSAAFGDRRPYFYPTASALNMYVNNLI